MRRTHSDCYFPNDDLTEDNVEKKIEEKKIMDNKVSNDPQIDRLALTVHTSYTTTQSRMLSDVFTGTQFLSQVPFGSFG